ncbi:MAG: rod shape-determining protein MreC [Ruminococcaceae bacterium]|nr:rod shape-determining protein MreC [Oscillospiraceae bacterium]
MSKFLRSRFFIIALLIAIVLVTVPSVLSFMGLGSSVRSALGTLATPFRYCFTQVAQAADGFISYFKEFDAINAENRILKDKNAELQNKLRDVEAIKEENEWLYAYLGLKREHIDYEFESALVIGRESGNYMTVLTLNRGSMHDIETNMPVVTENGIVGYVSEAGANWCKVVTILETASSVGAYVKRSGELGLVEGVYELKDNGICQMSYLPSDADIKVGDIILSSGIGSFYPRGLVIGTVTELVPDEFSRSLIARIKPSADLTDLRRVMIIKDFNAYTEDVGGEVNE